MKASEATPTGIAEVIRHLVADTEVKLNVEERERGYLLEDLMGRLVHLACGLDGLEYIGGPFAVPAYPLRHPDELIEMLREF